MIRKFFCWNFTLNSATFIDTMTSERNVVKYKRLKVVRALMYLDALFLVLSVALLDPNDLSFAANSACYARIIVLLAIFGVLICHGKEYQPLFTQAS